MTGFCNQRIIGLFALVSSAVFLYCLTGCSILCDRRPVFLSMIQLPEKYNTPDGMVLCDDGCIYLNCLNSNNPQYPPKLIKIDENNTLSEVFTFEPETAVLGIDRGKDGNFYIADSKSFFGKENGRSNLLRLVMEDGRAVRCEVVVKGFNMSNAVSCHGDYVYVTETKLSLNASPLPSGVYRFSYDELTPDAPIALLPEGKDPRLITQFTTDNETWAVGANGMGFDSKGNMYVCNFGEASLLKFTFNEEGEITDRKVFAKGGGMQSTDGLKIDPHTDDVYIADFVGNAVHKVDAETGAVTTILKNANNTKGEYGLLDKPSEVCLRGECIYVSNIDLSMGGNEFDSLHTLSVLRWFPVDK